MARQIIVHPKEPDAVPIPTVEVVTTFLPPTAPAQAKCCDPCDCQGNKPGNFPLGFGIYGFICLILSIVMFGLDSAIAVNFAGIYPGGGFWAAIIGILASSLASAGLGPPPKRGVVIACSVFSTIAWILCIIAAAIDSIALAIVMIFEAECLIATALIDDKELANICDYIDYLYSLCSAGLAFDIICIFALFSLAIMTYVSLCCSSRVCACCGCR